VGAVCGALLVVAVKVRHALLPIVRPHYPKMVTPTKSAHQNKGKKQKKKKKKSKNPPQVQKPPRPKPKGPVSKFAYIEDELRPDDAKGFRASGIFAYRRDKSGEWAVLMGSDRSRSPVSLNLLGGRRETADRDDARVTASREFWEESGCVLPADTRDNMAKSLSRVMWFPDGKYALYLYEMDHDLDICERLSEIPPEKRPDDCEMQALYWVPCDSLARLLAVDNSSPSHKSKPDNDPLRLGDSNHVVSWVAKGVLRRLMLFKEDPLVKDLFKGVLPKARKKRVVIGKLVPAVE